jgi:CRP/FNR family transcriptional regulator, cyclic AMP receptor protein
MTMTTIERVIALQRVGLFAEVPLRTLAAVAQRATEIDVRPGTTVIHEGAVEDHLFAVVRGRLRVHHGHQQLRILGAGATVGELAALVPEPRSASVTVLEPATLLRIDKAVLDELLADRPEVASGVISALVAMLRERTRGDENNSSA